MKNELKLFINNGERQGETINLSAGEYIFGRDDSVDIVLTGKSISRRHFKITNVENCFYIEDLNSQNGTRINNQLAEKPVKITDSCEISAGEIKLTATLNSHENNIESSNKTKLPKNKKKIKLPGQQESSPLAKIIIFGGIIGMIIFGITKLNREDNSKLDSTDTIKNFTNTYAKCFNNLKANSTGYEAENYEAADALATSFYRLERYRDAMNMYQKAKELCNQEHNLRKYIESFSARIEVAKYALSDQIVGKISSDYSYIKPGHYWTAKLQEEKLYYEGALRQWDLVKNAVGKDHPFYNIAKNNIEILKICINKKFDKNKWNSLTLTSQKNYKDELTKKENKQM